jgi:uncharacterized protein YcbK (DUF882 family)
MFLKNLSNEALLLNTKNLVVRERELLNQVLHHLREIESRRLYASLGFASLFDYAVKELCYSASAAARRINAMRLLKDLPAEVEDALKDGKLSLSQLASVQVFLKHEKNLQGRVYSTDEKLDLVTQLQGTSQREAEKLLVSLSPDSTFKHQERVRPVAQNLSEFKTVISDELLKKLERVRELVAHRTQSGQWSDVLEVMADKAIEALDPALVKISNRKAKEKKLNPSGVLSLAPKPDASNLSSKAIVSNSTPKFASRYISKPLKKSIFQRAQGQCEFVEPRTHRRCSCRSFLQVDHITPLALGGRSVADNLRVLCRAHNIHAAVQVLGPMKIEKYLKPQN